jgi:Clp amino terminal domain, pathogenicity island component
VLEFSLRESQRLGHDHIGAEHILLGLIREGESVAAQVPVRFGAEIFGPVGHLARRRAGSPSPWWRSPRGSAGWPCRL